MTAPGTDLEFRTLPLERRYEWSQRIANAGDLVPAGFRDRNGAPNPSKVLLAVETGNSLGLHPMTALNGIHVIEGKPTLSSALMTALVHRAGHKLRIRTGGSIKAGTYTATATLIRADDPEHPFEAVWDQDRAKRAGLAGKNTWGKYPEAMLKARAVSEVARDGASDVLLGVLYTAEEMGAEVDAEGNLTGEVIEDAILVPNEPEPPAYVKDVADHWFGAITSATFLGPNTDDGGGLRALYRQARKEGVLAHPIDEADDGATSLTVADLISQVAGQLPEDDPAATGAPMVLDSDTEGDDA